MEKIMDNEGSKKIFSYDKDISFYEFKDYFKTFYKEISKEFLMKFTILYLFFILSGSSNENNNIYDYLLVLALYLFCIFLWLGPSHRKKYEKKQYKRYIYLEKGRNNVSYFYKEYFISNVGTFARKIYYIDLKKIIENDKYFYLIYDTKSPIWLNKKVLNDEQKDFIRNININVYKNKCRKDKKILEKN